MSDVFVSYSRRDSDFVRRVADSIAERGKEVWLDTEGIADGEVFPEAIKRAIEQSDAFLFVITPESVHSAYCENEVEYARQMQKRILPVLREPVSDSELPAEIRDRNWIPFIDDAEFDPAVGRLMTALDTDLEANQAHTRWLVKALEWDKEGRDNSFLLRGSELKAAEAWLAASPEDADPAPTSLQREYLLASRNASARRQRVLMGLSVAVAAVSIGLLIFALISRGQAVSEKVSARSQALAAESQAQLPNDPEISLILGMHAVQTKATPESEFALRAALDASPLELGLPTATVPSACSGFLAGGLNAAYSPDGRQIAEGVCSGHVRLLDPATGRLERTVNVRGTSPVAYSPNSSTLAIATGTGVTLLNPRTGAIVKRLAGGPHGQVFGLAFSPDGRMLGGATPSGVIVWTLPAGRERTLAQTPAQGFSLAFSPDGRRIYAGGLDALVRVYDVASGREVEKIDPFPGNDGQSWALVVAASHDGRRLAIGYPGGVNETGVVSIYSTRTWHKEFDVTSIPQVEISAMAFSPDDSRLAIGAFDGTAGVWSLVAREQLAAYDGPTASVNSVSFTPDGSSVLTASNDGILRVWRAVGTERAFMSFGGSIDQMVLRGNALEVPLNASVGGWWLAWVRLPGGHVFRTVRLLNNENNGFANLSSDGRFVAVARYSGQPAPAPLNVVDAATGRVVRQLGPLVLSPVGLPTFSPDDSKLVFQEFPSAAAAPRPGTSNGPPSAPARVVVMTVATGHTLLLPKAQACSPGSPDIWAFSGDGRRIAQESFCGIVNVWDADSGRLLRQVHQNAETSAVALNHDGSRLLVSSWDSRATVWSVTTGRQLVNFVGHTRGIADAAFSPDGTRVVTTSLDHTVRVWDARTGQMLRVLTFPDDQTSVSLSTDGSELAVADNAAISGVPDIVRVYDTCPACQNASALLKLAAPHATANLTQLERTVLSGS